MTFKDQFPEIPGPLFPSAPLFKELELLKVKEIFILQIAKFIHKCINVDINSNIDHWFKFNYEAHAHLKRSNYSYSTLDNTNNLFISFGRTTNYGLKLIKVSGPKMWNSLPLDIRIKKSLSNFKSSLKKYLLETSSLD